MEILTNQVPFQKMPSNWVSKFLWVWHMNFFLLTPLIVTVIYSRVGQPFLSGGIYLGDNAGLNPRVSRVSGRAGFDCRVWPVGHSQMTSLICWLTILFLQLGDSVSILSWTFIHTVNSVWIIKILKPQSAFLLRNFVITPNTHINLIFIFSAIYSHLNEYMHHATIHRLP
jgi:hypothetical protein